MRKSGTVISILKDKKSGVQRFGLILDNSETEEACSINTDGNQVKDCASCSGCGFSKQKKGMFVVTGNMVTAVNKSGKNIHIGDSVQLEIQESKAKLQAVFSVFVPALFAAAAAYIFYSFFKTEIASISGLFLGLALGGTAALLIKKIAGDKSLPEIAEVVLKSTALPQNSEVRNSIFRPVHSQKILQPDSNLFISTQSVGD